LSDGLVGRLLSILLASTKTSFTGASGSPEGGFTDIKLAPGILTEDPFSPAPAGEPPAKRGAITITARDFRVLDFVDWRPGGVCLLAGPNGSGKSSLLEVPVFLRNAYVWGLPMTLGIHRGADGLRRSEAAGPPEVLAGIQVGNLT